MTRTHLPLLAIYPRLLELSRRREFCRLAVAVKETFEIKREWPLNIIDLCKRAGIPMYQRALDYLGAIGCRDQRGRIDVFMVVQSGIDPTIRHFVLAHLLGHYFLHIQPHLLKTERPHHGFRENSWPFPEKYSNSQKQEFEATAFALEILLPRSRLSKAIRAGMSAKSIAQKLQLPELMIRKRCLQDSPIRQQVKNKLSQSTSVLMRIRKIAKKIDDTVQSS